MSWESGTILAVLGVTLPAIWQIWDRLGKGKADAFARSEGERDRLEKRVQATEQRLDTVEAELEALKVEHSELKQKYVMLLDFLRDIVSGRFDEKWVIGRAHDLLDRLWGGK